MQLISRIAVQNLKWNECVHQCHFTSCVIGSRSWSKWPYVWPTQHGLVFDTVILGICNHTDHAEIYIIIILYSTFHRLHKSWNSQPFSMMTSSNGIISALLAICAGNSPVTGEFPAQRAVMRSFDVFFDLCLNKRLGKQNVKLVIWDAIAPIMTSQ